MTVGIITGTGTYALPEFEDAQPERVATPWGTAELTRGRFAGTEVLHVSRHGEGHPRLSSHVNHRANVWALREAGARAAIGCTACGALDQGIALGSLIVFDDLHFLANRLADGSICSFWEEGDRLRGHWIYERPYSEQVREALLDGAAEAGRDVRDGGCYGHVDGPRFNTASEIRTLAQAGVTAVSQTAGPETVLCGEAELPYALLGFPTDYANAVAPTGTPVEELIRLMGESTGIFASVLAGALPLLAEAELRPSGVMFRFEGD